MPTRPRLPVDESPECGLVPRQPAHLPAPYLHYAPLVPTGLQLLCSVCCYGALLLLKLNATLSSGTRSSPTHPFLSDDASSEQPSPGQLPSTIPRGHTRELAVPRSTFPRRVLSVEATWKAQVMSSATAGEPVGGPSTGENSSPCGCLAFSPMSLCADGRAESSF